jgi:hypothetical protein
MITELQKQKRRLHAQIAEAFDAVPYPGDDNLCDGRQQDDDYEDVIRNLTGKHWRELMPKRKPPKGRSNPLLKDLNFCSPMAWRFFLPAYLIIDLMRGEIDTFLFEPPTRPAPKFDCLNTAQCAVVASFLGFAGLLLDDKQKKMPMHFQYFQHQREELSPVIAYWNDRTKL